MNTHDEFPPMPTVSKKLWKGVAFCFLIGAGLAYASYLIVAIIANAILK